MSSVMQIMLKQSGIYIIFFFFFPPHFRNRGKYFALILFWILDLDKFDFSHDRGLLKVLDITMVTVPLPLPDGRKWLLLLWREGCVWPKEAEAADPNFQGSPVLPFHLLSTSLFFLFLGPSHGRGNLTLASDQLLIHGLSPFTHAAKNLRRNSGKHSSRHYLSWNAQASEYLLNAVATELYHQCNALTQHSSVLNLGTVLKGLTAVGFYLHLPR